MMRGWWEITLVSCVCSLTFCCSKQLCSLRVRCIAHVPPPRTQVETTTQYNGSMRREPAWVGTFYTAASHVPSSVFFFFASDMWSSCWWGRNKTGKNTVKTYDMEVTQKQTRSDSLRFGFYGCQVLPRGPAANTRTKNANLNARSHLLRVQVFQYQAA